MITVNSLILIITTLILGLLAGIAVAWYLYKDMGIKKVAPYTTFKETESVESMRVMLTDETSCSTCHTTGIGVKHTYLHDDIKGGFSIGGYDEVTKYFCLYHAHDPDIIAEISRNKLNNNNYNNTKQYVRNITDGIVHTTKRLCEYAEDVGGYECVNQSEICDAEFDDDIIELESRTRLQFLHLIPQAIIDPTIFTQPGDRDNLRRLWEIVYTATDDEDEVSNTGTMSSMVEPQVEE